MLLYQAFQIMEEELGRPIAQVFSSISEHPIAAASLGQVVSASPGSTRDHLSCTPRHSLAHLCVAVKQALHCVNDAVPALSGVQGRFEGHGRGGGHQGAAARCGAGHPARPAHFPLHGALHQPHLKGAATLPRCSLAWPVLLRETKES